MNKFGQKSSITDKDFMIHILKNVPKEYHVILYGLEIYLMAIRGNALTINMNC